MSLLGLPVTIVALVKRIDMVKGFYSHRRIVGTGAQIPAPG